MKTHKSNKLLEVHILKLNYRPRPIKLGLSTRTTNHPPHLFLLNQK